MTHPSQERSTRTVTPPTTDTEPRRDLSVLDFIGTLRWIADNGGIPAAGSEREARLVELWERRLRLTTAERASGGLDVERLAKALYAKSSKHQNFDATVKWAEDIAAEYARLATPQPGEPRP